MAESTLEARVAELERQVAEMRRHLSDGVIGPDPRSKWWERLRPLSAEAIQAMEEMAPYQQYFRQTGQDPPPDWRPGDPIPEPDHWK
jgi:hypothetical protein